MIDWIFLIQREGDRSWQPIQTPTLEIEECRYRIIGQTDVTDLCVEVRIQVQPLEESTNLSPCRQTYFRRTDSQGLIIILPYTYFYPGLWELSCCCDALSELMGETWRISQQIFSVPKAGYLGLPNTYTTPCLEETELDLSESVPSHKTLQSFASNPKVLPPKLNPSSGKVQKKSPQLPKFSS